MLKRTSDPEDLGLCPQRMSTVYEVTQKAVDEGKVMGAAIQVARSGVALEPRAFGRRSLDPRGPSVQPDTVFLVASITKPVTVTAAMLLVERGELCLDDRVCDYVSEFAQKGKEGVRIRHLMTHTSGLPDMLPENSLLRSRKAPLKVFVQRVCEEGLLFPPGTNVSYQSMGTAMLGEVAERIEGVPLPESLRREVFHPLGLTATSLGVQDSLLERVSDVNMARSKYDYTVPGAKEWDLNSAYWRHFAAPWGGMFSTVEDTTVLCQMFLAGGHMGDTRIIAPATARAMTTDQTSKMPDLPECVKLRERWGLGWRLISPASVPWMGDLVSPDTYGHIGSTGTMAWMDPRSGLSCVLFTNDVVGADALRPRVTNAVMGALVES